MATLLLPLDGSDYSEQAIPYACLMSRLLDAEIHLLHVATAGEQHHFATNREQLRRQYLPMREPVDTASSALLTHDEAYLRQQLLRIQAAHVPAVIEVVFGVPEQAIVEAAERCDAALIIMATHGRGGLGRWLVGSVAHKLLRITHRPLLAVRAQAPADLAVRSILVPLDGSARACEALPVARDLARRTGAPITLLTVLAPLYGLDPSAVPALHDSEAIGIRARLLARLQEHAAETPDLAVTVSLAEGLVGETICREAAARSVDMIVMASHGYGGRRLLNLGSVTDSVLHHTCAPVLVVPTHVGEHAEAGVEGAAMRHTA